MHIETSVIVLSIFLLEILHQLGQSALFFRHYVGQKQSVQNAVSFGQMPRNSDSSRLFPSDQNVAFQHKIADVLETYTAFVQPASMFGGDAIKHLGGIESAHHLSRPFFPFEQPAQQDGIDLMGIDVAAVFSHSANAVSVSIGDQTAMAAL